jgi:hypothetical protein
MLNIVCLFPGDTGPEIRDSATIFRINSTYMDVSDQPHMMRQWLAGGTLTACLATLAFLYAVVIVLFIHRLIPKMPFELLILVMILSSPMLFGGIAVWFGRGEFFSLIRRPIRFNRETRKIYALRERRHLDGHIVGDIFWEIPWDEKSIFCVHKGPDKFELHEHFHIRCYQVDSAPGFCNRARVAGYGRNA